MVSFRFVALFEEGAGDLLVEALVAAGEQSCGVDTRSDNDGR